MKQLPGSSRLLELTQLFLHLGSLGFGGPQAHLALLHEEVVVRRHWLSEEAFLEGVAICEMLPGPASTQMGIYTGFVRGGPWGAFVAGISFITPAFLIVLVLSWFYFRYQQLPQLQALFLGISPVIIAIIWGFCWKLARKGIQDGIGIALALGVCLASAVGKINVLVLFLTAGCLGMIVYRQRTPPAQSLGLSQVVPLFPPTPWLANLTSEPLLAASFWHLERLQTYGIPLSLFFLKIGSFIFGGGLVIVPLMETEVVHQFQWLTPHEFLNGVAIGELTPGPVVITAAFIGYKVAGCLGSLLATVSIFAPSFAFILIAAPLLSRWRQVEWVKSFLRGVTPAVLGAVAAATLPLSLAAFARPTLLETLVASVLGLAALIALIRFRRPTWQLVLSGAAVGLGWSLVLP